MVLEATMLVLDNSEWMRNGDYTPTRVGAQNDAVNLIFSTKTQSNPENTVGLMTMAGKSPEVLVTLTNELGKILSALHSVKLSGKVDFITGVQIAQLALKHRQNKNQRQRLVVFVGSPIDTDEKTLVKLAKKMKKNNVAVDVVNFGEEGENTAKLDAFVNSVNSGDNSHLVTIPPGPHILSDMLIPTPIIAGEDGVPPGLAAGGTGNFDFGVDPGLDPELALVSSVPLRRTMRPALRISLEEEKARQEAEAAKAKGTATQEGQASGSGSAVEMAVDSGSGAGAVGGDEDELQAALRMSMGAPSYGILVKENWDVNMDDLSEEEQIARAIAMSMQGGSGGGQESGEDFSQVMQDPSFLTRVLDSLPGVDSSDPRIQSVLQGKDSEKKEGEEDKEKK
ncbi:hypothetical protein BC938DRAFT_474587 [Jimgerdemannia flammicorona]|uniref:26S proteasome regulatory subunit RPN10 n=1 Tax=Jimgerdemannia flammicorona TaxID=994334 RepID=A0A433QSD5_9FUNG|nr:hypothetical protein BC938DRAFT_474587 [Jimgerdemannia flammicorona]